jgi:hypothetical protein
VAVRGESQTAPRAGLFRQFFVIGPSNAPGIRRVLRICLTKHPSLGVAQHFHRGLLALAVPALAAAALGPLYGGRLTLEAPSLPASLAPARPTDAGSRLAAGLVHETLIRWDASGAPAAGVACRWTRLASGREWELELCPGARFHGGGPVRAEDVARSLLRYLRHDSTAAAVLAGRLEGGLPFRSRNVAELSGIAAPAADRVRLRLARPVLDPLAPLAAAAAAITDADGRGCGPFAPAVFEPGRRLDLVAAADHPAGRPFLDRVQIRVAPASDARNGPGTTPLLLVLALDATRPPFDEPARRHALAASIDREALSARFLNGAHPAFGVAGRPGVAPPPPPPAPREPAPIALSVADDVPAAASRRVVAHLAAAGVSAEVSLSSPGNARRAQSAARLLLWAPEVSSFDLVLREAATLVRVPAAVERALRTAEAELDPVLRAEQLEQAHSALLADAALIPLAALPLALRPPPGLHGARVDATGTLRLDDAWFHP